jgi:hypothetical protein
MIERQKRTFPHGFAAFTVRLESSPLNYSHGRAIFHHVAIHVWGKKCQIYSINVEIFSQIECKFVFTYFVWLLVLIYLNFVLWFFVEICRESAPRYGHRALWGQRSFASSYHKIGVY